MPRPIIYLLFIVTLLFGCKEEPTIVPPDPLLEEELYVNLLVEMKIIDAFLQSTDRVAVADSLKNELFILYEVDEETFLLNHEYFQSQPEEQILRLQQANELIEAAIDSINTGKAPSPFQPGNNR